MLKRETITSTIIRARSKPFVQIACILLCGVLAYANTFNVPFIFDDNGSIVDNSHIKNLSNFWPPSGTRWFGSFTFALNYAAGGLQVSGYHCVNLAIHLAASLLVYRLVALTFRTPFFSAGEQTAEHEQTALLSSFAAAFIFVSHPIQTQAVTYIVQRFASLATLLFLASMVCYVQARLSHAGNDTRTPKQTKSTAAWLAIALLLAVLAMTTKEIAFTLPIVIVLYELAFFPGRPLIERLQFLIPVLLTLLIIPYNLSGVDYSGVSVASRATTAISRHDYLLTQSRVLVTYLRLLVLPVNQMIDYDYPIFRDLFDPSLLLSLLLLSSLFILSILSMIKGGRGKIPSEARIVGFGGLWFFITLAVESSVIPITDVLFEHRLYLPSVGAFMAAAVTAAFAVNIIGARFPRSVCGISAILACILGALPVATHFRNDVWSSEISLWEDAAKKSPGNARARAIIGIKLIQAGKIDGAIRHFQEALRIKPDYADATICLGSAYMARGMLDEAYQQYLKALMLGSLDSESTAQLMMNIGNYFFKKGLPDRAVYYYQSALSITPNAATIHYNLAQTYKIKGLMREAADEFARARQLNPERY
jgi:hypothetical protein